MYPRRRSMWAALVCVVCALQATPLAARIVVDARQDVWLRQLGTDRSEQAIAALVRLGEPVARPLIDVIREHDDDEAAWQAMRALRRLGERARSGEGRLLSIMRDRELPVTRRAMAVAAIGGFGPAGHRSIGALLQELRHQPPNMVQIMCSIALGEIGAPATFRLSSELRADDGLTVVLISCTLSQIGGDARRATKQLKKSVQSLALGNEENYFLVQPIAASLLEQLGVAYEPAPFAGPLLNEELGPEFELSFYRGGQLDAAWMLEPAPVRGLMAANFRRMRDREDFALPARLEDCDGDAVLTVGELTRDLSVHLSHEIAELAQRLARDDFKTNASWRATARPVEGLLFAVFELTRPRFLERSMSLGLVAAPFRGLFPPKQRE